MVGSAGRRVFVAPLVAGTRLATSSMRVGDAEFLVAERWRRVSSGHLLRRWPLSVASSVTSDTASPLARNYVGVRDSPSPFTVGHQPGAPQDVGVSLEVRT
jgi:hypothetical protein